MGLKGGFEIIRQLNVARLFQDGPLVVLDLTRLKQKADEDAIDKLN